MTTFHLIFLAYILIGLFGTFCWHIIDTLEEHGKITIRNIFSGFEFSIFILCSFLWSGILLGVTIFCIQKKIRELSIWDKPIIEKKKEEKAKPDKTKIFLESI